VREGNLRACSKVLQKATITLQPFEDITPVPGDLVYFDPPYHPVANDSFTGYTKSDFTEQDQERLRDFAVRLGKQSVKVMLSNSDTPFIRHLYKASTFKIATVQAPRMVNCKGTGRDAVNELIITNY
jgi:DNA adenine methylase